MGGNIHFGSGATLHSSPDGYAWSLVGASPVVPLAHLGSLWFGAAGAALLQSSDNGLSWTPLRPDSLCFGRPRLDWKGVG